MHDIKVFQRLGSFFCRKYKVHLECFFFIFGSENMGMGRQKIKHVFLYMIFILYVIRISVGEQYNFHNETR